MSNWGVKRNAYCEGCYWWRYFNHFYGCFKFKVYRFDEFDRLCGGRYYRHR